jgi:biotin operon repressor
LAALAGVGGALAVAATGCGDGSGQATAAGNANNQSHGAQQGRPGMMDTPALAQKLGVSESKLKAALESIRPTSQGGAPPQPGEMATKLAKALGLSESKVQAALQSMMPQGGPPNGGQPPSGTTS